MKKTTNLALSKVLSITYAIVAICTVIIGGWWGFDLAGTLADTSADSIAMRIQEIALSKPFLLLIGSIILSYVNYWLKRKYAPHNAL